MISFTKNFLFIHVQKTAGHSIRDEIRPYTDKRVEAEMQYKAPLQDFGVVRDNGKWKLGLHSSYENYKNRLETDVFDNLYKFSTIRNPYARVVSHHYDKVAHCGAEDTRSSFLQTAQSVATLRQLWCVGDEALDANLNRVIRFENLQADFDKVCDEIGINRIVLPKKNKGTKSHSDYLKRYDDETLQIVRDRFAEEIEYGNYAAENV